MPLRLSRSFKLIDFGTNRKLMCDFLLVINTNLHRNTCTVSIIGQIFACDCDSRRPHFNAVVAGDPLRTCGCSLSPQKLEWVCYLTVKTVWSYLYSSGQNTGTWRTDRDRRKCRGYYSACIASNADALLKLSEQWGQRRHRSLNERRRLVLLYLSLQALSMSEVMQVLQYMIVSLYTWSTSATTS